MKKIFYAIIVILSFCVTTTVHASGIPYTWSSNGVDLSTGTNPNAKVTKDGKTINLILNNYNGGQLKLDVYGTGQEGVTFNIILTGDNYITADNIGIDFNYSGKINFTGDGSLTIKAPKTITYETIAYQLYINPSKGIYSNSKPQETAKQETVTQDTSKNDEKTTEDKKDEETKDEDKNDNKVNSNSSTDSVTANNTKENNNGKLMFIICVLGVLVTLLVIAVIYLVIKTNKLSK